MSSNDENRARFKNHTDVVGRVVKKTSRIERYFDLTKNIAFNMPNQVAFWACHEMSLLGLIFMYAE